MIEFVAGLVVRGLPIDQQFGIGLDARQGGPKLVRDVRHEIGLHLGDIILARAVVQDRHDAGELIGVVHHAGEGHGEGAHLPVDFQQAVRRAAVGAGGGLPHVRDVRRELGRLVAEQLRDGAPPFVFQGEAEHGGGRGIGQQQLVVGVGDDHRVGNAVDHRLGLTALRVGEAQLDLEVLLLQGQGFRPAAQFSDFVAQRIDEGLNIGILGRRQGRGIRGQRPLPRVFQDALPVRTHVADHRRHAQRQAQGRSPDDHHAPQQNPLAGWRRALAHVQPIHGADDQTGRHQ